MLQLEYHALARCQFLQRPRNPSAQLAPHQIPLGVSAASPICYLRQHVVLLAFRIRRHWRIFFSHLLLPDVVQTQIRHDPVNPGVERTLETETPNALVSLQERFLINILRFVFRSRQVQSQAQYRLIILAHQFLEGGAATVLRLAHQKGVVNSALT